MSPPVYAGYCTPSPKAHYLTERDPCPRFGLGKDQRIDMVEVRWPSGTVSTILDLNGNREALLR